MLLLQPRGLTYAPVNRGVDGYKCLRPSTASWDGMHLITSNNSRGVCVVPSIKPGQVLKGLIFWSQIILTTVPFQSLSFCPVKNLLLIVVLAAFRLLFNNSDLSLAVSMAQKRTSGRSRSCLQHCRKHFVFSII